MTRKRFVKLMMGWYCLSRNEANSLAKEVQMINMRRKVVKNENKKEAAEAGDNPGDADDVPASV